MRHGTKEGRREGVGGGGHGGEYKRGGSRKRKETEKRGSESEVLEGHPLSARFLGSQPLATKGLGRP